MHFEILVEDVSGKQMLDILVPKILGQNHTYKVISYKGLGRFPRNLEKAVDTTARILLEQLPKLLKGYGKAGYDEKQRERALFIICDLDDHCLKEFRTQFLELVSQCPVKPLVRLCCAVEEIEAWFLGDQEAIRAAYPKVKKSILKSYEQDRVCGTWELLANALLHKGVTDLKKRGFHAIGGEKMRWASMISPAMEIERNISPSFMYFIEKIKELMVASGEGPALTMEFPNQQPITQQMTLPLFP